MATRVSGEWAVTGRFLSLHRLRMGFESSKGVVGGEKAKGASERAGMGAREERRDSHVLLRAPLA